MLTTIRGGAPIAKREALTTAVKKVIFFGTSLTVWLRIKNLGTGVVRLYTTKTEAEKAGGGSQYVTLADGEVLEGMFETTGFWMVAESGTPVVECLAGIRTP